VQDDQIIETYIPPPHPRGIELSGQWVRLEPLDISRHSKDLFQANTTIWIVTDQIGRICPMGRLRL